MFGDGENMSVIEVEVETLESIYLNELDVQLDESGTIVNVSVQLNPATADIVEEQYVMMCLSFKIPEEYPDSIPEMSIHNSRGLLDEQIDRIAENLLQIAENKKGSSMLYELIEVAKQQLTDANRPLEDCAICLYGFFEEDVFMKTECYHYFHSHCLSRYVQCKLEEKKKEEEEKSSIEHEEIDTSKNVPCPVCRVPISFDSTRDDFPEPIGVSDAVVDIDSIDLNQQHEMNRIYKKQLEQGGIIDLEAESRKYLLEISNVPDVPISETGSTKINSCTSKENTDDVSNGSSSGVRNKRSPYSTTAKSTASNLQAKGSRNWKSKYQSTQGTSDWTEYGEDCQKTDAPNEYDAQSEERESSPPRGHRNPQNFRQRGGRPQRGPRFGGSYQNDNRYIPRNNGYRSGNFQSGYRQGSSQSGYKQNSSQGSYRQGNAQGSYRQGNSQGIGYRQDNSQGGYRQGNSQGGYRQGNSQGGYRQGNSQGGYRQGNSQGGYRQGNFQSSRPYNRRNRVNDNFRSRFDENDASNFKEDSHSPSSEYSLDTCDSKRTEKFLNEDTNQCEGGSQDQESSSAERLDSQSQASEQERTSHSSARNDDWSSREEKPDYQRRNNFRSKPQYSHERSSGNQYQNYRDKSEESDATLQDASCSGSESHNEKPQRYLGNRNSYRNNGGYDNKQHGDRKRNPNWRPRYNSGPRHNYRNDMAQSNRNSYQDRNMQAFVANSTPEEIPKCSVSNGCSSLEREDDLPKLVESDLMIESPAVAMPGKVPQDENDISQEKELKIMCGMVATLRSPPGFANPHKKVVYGLPSVNPPPGFGQS